MTTNAATATFAAGWRRPVEKEVFTSPGRLKRARTLPLCVGRPSPGDCWRALLEGDPGSELEGDPGSEEDSRTRSMWPNPYLESFPRRSRSNLDTILPC
jgi:hypothetical protein